MLILVLVRARNDLKHHHERGKMNPAVHMVRKTDVIRTPEWSKEITRCIKANIQVICDLKNG